MELNGTFDAAHALGIPTGAPSTRVVPVPARDIIAGALEGSEVSLQGVYHVARELGVLLEPAPPAGLVCAVRKSAAEAAALSLGEVVLGRTRGGVRAILCGEGSDEGTLRMVNGLASVPAGPFLAGTLASLESSEVLAALVGRVPLNKKEAPWSGFAKNAVRKARRYLMRWMTKARRAVDRELVTSTLSQLRQERAAAPWASQPSAVQQVAALLEESYKAHPRLSIAGAGSWPATAHSHVWFRLLQARAGADGAKLELRPYRATLPERVGLARRAVAILQPSWSPAERENTSLSHVRSEFPELPLYPFFPLDISFGGVDGPNLVAGFNTVYGGSRGSQNRRTVVRALRRQLSAKFMVLLDEIAREWRFDNVDDLWRRFDADPPAAVARYPDDVRRNVDAMFQAERRFASALFASPDYFPPELPTPTTALVLEWRRRSWDVSYARCLWNVHAPPKEAAPLVVSAIPVPAAAGAAVGGGAAAELDPEKKM